MNGKYRATGPDASAAAQAGDDLGWAEQPSQYSPRPPTGWERLPIPLARRSRE